MARPDDTVLKLVDEAHLCTNCDLYKNSQLVFSEGDPHAAIMMIGEAPGDVEDRRGRPFVGPAGKLLRDLIAEAGLKESELYLTNAVKHFKWEPRGNRRLHVKPNYSEVTACKPWLIKELELVRPRIVVCLGATAGSAFFGADFRVLKNRGEIFSTPNYLILTTVHPSSVLRMPTPETRAAARAELLSDLIRVQELLYADRNESELHPAATRGKAHADPPLHAT